MKKPFKNTLFIFHRDLRINDNRALNAALEQSELVTCAFVVDPVFNQKPETRQFAKQFLLGALKSLDDELHELDSGLLILSGAYVDIIKSFLADGSVFADGTIDAVFVNCEYTKNGRRRLEQLRVLLESLDIALCVYDDVLLFPPGFILKADGLPYTIFTPFYNKAKQFPVEKVKPLKCGRFQKLKPEYRFSLVQLAEYWQITPTNSSIRNQRIGVLKDLVSCQNYSGQRDFPALGATSHLSVHLKFGTLSVREVYWSITKHLGADSPLLRQLYWRDFFNHIGFHFPHVFSSAFHLQYANIHWANDLNRFVRWCEGKTGFPIVDAGMRELNATGYMHNRVRMIVASFLVKDLHIDWRWGERYFAETLIDYDCAVNNGNWQWAASTGCDAQPYFRIFNPWLQQQKFDAQCEYIYRWIPELTHFSPKDIHNWFKVKTLSDYPEPMVDHASASQQAKLLFKEAADINRKKAC
jgi:deoxyribodipyrimidine photo-lyase